MTQVSDSRDTPFHKLLTDNIFILVKELNEHFFYLFYEKYFLITTLLTQRIILHLKLVPKECEYLATMAWSV